MYTHTFEIVMDGVNIVGEIQFKGKPSFRTEAGEEMTIQQHGVLQSLLEVMGRIANCCDDIDKIEVVKKP